MDDEMKKKWVALEESLTHQFGKKPDMNAILFLIGVRELGVNMRKFNKEEKMGLMHIATCKILSYSGYYELEGHDQDGWPHWKPVKPLPFIDLFSQETFLKQHVIEYFQHLQ
jgi:hypothetical protein